MTVLWKSREAAEAVAETLRRIAQGQRLMILSLLLDGERSVTQIDVATGIGQPALSQQLAELRKGELVKTRRQAKQVYYSLDGENAILYIRGIEAMFAGSTHISPKPATVERLRDRSAVTPGTANFARLL
ncbi:hypothetical protein NRB_09560 [Novosphingobium sp. 11B]